ESSQRSERKGCSAFSAFSAVKRGLAQAKILDDLQEIEAGVADHRRHARAAPQVGEAPERAEQSGRDRRVDALDEMARPKRRARDRDADRGSTEPDLEPMQEKRALNLFADSSGDENDQRKQPRV